MEEKEIKKIVKDGYARIARAGNASCCNTKSIGCGCNTNLAEDISKKIGYSEQDVNAVPEGSNLGLGCGNPVALASLKEGEVVLDLGSGGGFDCFLAADRVGKTGRVIGVDMTPDMIKRAKGNAQKGNYQNVEFRLGEIESLPVADSTVDVIISNCVINLVPDKGKAFAEAYRVLKPGGRLMVSDMVLLKELPELVRSSVEAYVGCLAGAIMKEGYLETIKAAGFQDVRVVDETSFPVAYMINDPTAQAIIKNLGITPELLNGMGDSVVSIKVQGIKPKQA